MSSSVSPLINNIVIGQCYRIISTTNSKCLIYDKNNESISLSQMNKTDNCSVWYFEPLPNNKFIIRSRDNHCTLNVESCNDKNDNIQLKLNQCSFDAITASNSYTITYNDNTISIKNDKFGVYLTDNLQQSASSPYFFGLQKVSASSTNLYRLKSQTLRLLDLEDQNAETTSVYAWIENGLASQIWELKKGPINDSVFIVNNLNKRVLDIYGCQREEGTNIRISNMKNVIDKSISNQLWSLEYENETACFQIRSLHNKKLVIDISGADNKTLLIWESNDGGNQRWQFEPYFSDRPILSADNNDNDDIKDNNDTNKGWLVEKYNENKNKFCLFGDDISDRKNHKYDYRAFCVDWFGFNSYTHLIASASPDHTVKLWTIDNNINNNTTDGTRVPITAFIELQAPGWINNMQIINNDKDDILKIVVTIREHKVYLYEISKKLMIPYINGKGHTIDTKDINVTRKCIELPFAPNERCFDVNNKGNILYIGFNEHSTIKLAGENKSCPFIYIDINTGIYKQWTRLQSDNHLDIYEYIDTVKTNKYKNLIGIGTRNASGLKNGQLIIAEINDVIDVKIKIIQKKTFNYAVTAIEFKENGIIIIGEDNGNVCILNDKLVNLYSFRSHYQKISNLSLMKDLLAVGSNDGDVTIHDLTGIKEEKEEKDTFCESVCIIDIEGIHGGGRVECVKLSPKYISSLLSSGQYLLSCAYGKLDQVHVRDICQILRENLKKELIENRKKSIAKKKKQEEKMKDSGSNKLSLKQVEALDSIYKDVSVAWLDLWKNAGKMLNIIESLSKPIITSLMDDKLKYLQVYNKEIIGNPVELAYYEGSNNVYGVVEKLNEIEYFTKLNKQKQDIDIKENDDFILIDKQLQTDLLDLVSQAKEAHKAIQKLANDLAEAVHGHAENDPGVKKAPRCVEKMCTRMIQQIDSDNDYEILHNNNQWDLKYDILKDIARAGVSFPDMKAIRDALFKLHQWQTGEYDENKIIEIARIKNRFDPSFDGIFGYRDLLINLRFLNPNWLNKNKWKLIFNDLQKNNYNINQWIEKGTFEWKQKRIEIIENLKQNGIGNINKNVSDWNGFWNLICVNYKIDNKLPNQYLYGSHICELQLHHEKIQEIRSSGSGHTNYSNSRFMIDFVVQMKNITKQSQDPNKEKIFKLIQELSECK